MTTTMTLMLKIILLIAPLLAAAAAAGDLVVMKLEDFEEDRLALHFPCKESNMFATNCACHLRCTGASCANAVDVCNKYSAIRVEGADGVVQTVRESSSPALPHFTDD